MESVLHAGHWVAGGDQLLVYVNVSWLPSCSSLTQGLDWLGVGLVTVSQSPMIDTAASLAGYQA